MKHHQRPAGSVAGVHAPTVQPTFLAVVLLALAVALPIGFIATAIEVVWRSF